METGWIKYGNSLKTAINILYIIYSQEQFFLVYRVNKDLKAKGTGMYAQIKSTKTPKEYLLKCQLWK